MASKLSKTDLVMLLEAIKTPAVPKDSIGQVQDTHDDSTVDVKFMGGDHKEIATANVNPTKLMSFKDHVTVTDSKFWDIIQDSRKESSDDDTFIEIITDKLVRLSIPDIYEFEKIYDQYHDKAYTTNLWAAANIINGGCSDDGFMDFRAWLISRGKEAYVNALQNPETLVDVTKVIETNYGSFGEAYLEAMNYVAWEAFEQKTEREMPLFTRDHPELTGVEWDEDTVDSLYPQLAAKFNRQSND